MGGGGDDAPAASESSAAPAASSTPATTAAAPAVPAPAAPAVPSAPEPVPPWVQAANQRKRIPIWAVPVLVLLPIWAAVYMLTLDKPTNKNSPLVIGNTVYNTMGCSGCHGASGGGTGNIPALTGNTSVLKEFPDPADQVTWVALGSAGYKAKNIPTLPGGLPVVAGMPAWETSLTPDQLMAVVLHERSTLNTEKFDIKKWEKNFKDKVGKLLPDQLAAYTAVLDEWKITPPTA